MGQKNNKRSKLAYSISEWAEVCSVGEAEVKAAIGERSLVTRRTQCGRLIVLLEDGLNWLRGMPII